MNRIVMGVDVGLKGAFAIVEEATGAVVSMEDMPTWTKVVGGTHRAFVDAVALAELVDAAVAVGVALTVIEDASGKAGPGGSYMSGYKSGYGSGLLRMSCVISRLRVEVVAPAVWKKAMRVTGKRRSKADVEEVTKRDKELAIIQRADEMFPSSRELWRGPKGGFRLDRAEAAMLAKYGIDHVLRSSASNGA